MFYGDLRDERDRQFLRDAIERMRGLFARVFAGDNVILLGRSLGFLRDERFREAFRRNAHNAQEKSLTLRLHTLTWAASHALHVEGDFVECGVWRGFCSAVVADYLGFADVPKTFWLYDTFEGIPADYDTEGHDNDVLREEGLHAKVVERFARFENVRVVKGVVPASFRDASPERIAFLHLDMNSSRSEREALEALWDRLSPGAVVVLDDYGWVGYEAQQRMADAFFGERGHAILELPTGQGLALCRGGREPAPDASS